jgi:hypothetical protein
VDAGELRDAVVVEISVESTQREQVGDAPTVLKALGREISVFLAGF